LEPANPPEPANQPALGRAADDAQAIAGSDYYTSTWVDAAANTVDVYLADAPQSIIGQLKARHPGIYVIHNDAAHPLSQLLRLQRALALGPLQTAAGTVNLVESYPTPDGHLKVGVRGTAMSKPPSPNWTPCTGRESSKSSAGRSERTTSCSTPRPSDIPEHWGRRASSLALL
jgi:hypothetical protein